MSISVTMTRCLSLLAFILAFPAGAQTDNDTIRPSAKPRFQVVDGDTVKFGPQLVRLFGIDAPEKGQTCDDGHWHPGPLAEKALEDFIAGRPVTCKQVDYDARNNRPVAQCYAGDDDLQALMVSAGWAWSFGRYSERYAPEEKEAANRKAGVHRPSMHAAMGVAGAAKDTPNGRGPVSLPQTSLPNTLVLQR